MKNDEINTPSKSNNEGIEECKQVFINDCNSNTSGTNPVKTNPRTLIVKCSDSFKKEFLDCAADTGKSCVVEQSKSDPRIVDETNVADHTYCRLTEQSPKNRSVDTDRMHLESKILINFTIDEDENRTDFNEFIDILRQFSRNVQTRNSKRTLSSDEEISHKRIRQKLSESGDVRPEMNSISTQTTFSCRKSTENQTSEKPTKSAKTFPFKCKRSRGFNKRVKSSPSFPQSSTFSLDDFIEFTTLMIGNMKELLNFIKGGTAITSSDEVAWEPSRIEGLNKRLESIPQEFGTGIESKTAKSSLETIETCREVMRNGAIKEMCYIMKRHVELARQEQSSQLTAAAPEILQTPDNALETSAGSENVSTYADTEMTKLSNVKLGKVTSPSVAPEKILPSQYDASNTLTSESVTPSELHSASVTPSELHSPSVAPGKLSSQSAVPSKLPSHSVAPDKLHSQSVTTNIPSGPAEVPEPNETSNNPSQLYQELLLLHQLEAVPTSLDTLYSDLNLFISQSESSLRNTVEMAESVIRDVLETHDQVMLEEISCHTWDLMYTIEYLLNLRRVCSTLLKINSSEIDRYVLKVKYYITRSLGILLTNAEQMMLHLEEFAIEHLFCN